LAVPAGRSGDVLRSPAQGNPQAAIVGGRQTRRPICAPSR